MKKKNRLLIVFLAIMCVSILYFYFNEYQQREKGFYDLYNDFTMADTVDRLSYQKELDNQMYGIKNVQSRQKGIKTTENDLIYDFATYEFVPILNYLESKEFDQKFIDNFANFWEFVAHHLKASLDNNWENIFIRHENGKYFVYDDGIYTYTIEKVVIGREEFNKLYDDYLKTINMSNVQEHFINKLLEEKPIKMAYTSASLKEELENNYDEFYENYMAIILKIIGSDLEQFGSYLKNRIILYDANGWVKGLKEVIPTETIRLDFKFKKFERVYSAVKYYNYIYDLDLKDVWKQTAALNYPKLYM